MRPTHIVPRYEQSPKNGTAGPPAAASPEMILRQLQRHRSRVGAGQSPSAGRPPRESSDGSRPASEPSYAPNGARSRTVSEPSRGGSDPTPTADGGPSISRTARAGQCAANWCGAGTGTHDCTLFVNEASANALFAFCLTVPGLGRRTANRILAVRESDGVFVSVGDFDRRVPRLTWSRFESCAAAFGVFISLDRPVRAKPTDSSDGSSALSCSIAGTFQSDPDAPMPDLCAHPVRIATWNAGHFTLNSQHLRAKAAHLVRFMRDSGGVAVLAMQEVHGEVPSYVARVFAEQLGGEWATVCPEADGECLMPVFVYDATRLAARNATSVIPEELLTQWLRRPVVALFEFHQPRTSGTQHFALANVHLSTRYKESEATLLPEAMQHVQSHLAEVGGEGDMCMLIGDFNVSADAACFKDLKDAGLIELVRPPETCSSPVEESGYLTTPTTVGKNWYDNFWMSGRARAGLEDAWCFDFGGRCRGLSHANAYEYAGMRRSLRSDHYAVVAQFKF